MKIVCVSLILALMSASSIAWSSTYYIDYASGSDSNNGASKYAPWKHHPYMKGFTGSYDHQGGDIFVFKGGVSWPYSASDPMYPWKIKVGGSSGNPDQYTVDKNWFDGSTWTSPVFDGCQTASGSNVCGLNGASTLGPQNFLMGDNHNVVSNIVINGLQLQNIGYPVSGSQQGSGETMLFEGGGGSITIANCVLIPQGLEAFDIDINNGQTSSQIYVHDNQISYAGRGVIFGFTGSNVSDVEVYNNKWEGPGPELTTILTNDGYHLDGLMIGDANERGPNEQPTINNVLFYGNDFYGQWDNQTSMFFSDGGINNISVYNNVFSIEQTSPGPYTGNMPAFVFIGRYGSYGNLNFYNNTFSSDSEVGTYGVGDGIFFNGSQAAWPTYINIKNNIFSGVNTGIELGSGTTWTSLSSNNNLYNLDGGSMITLDGGWNYTSTSSACSGGGYDCNSLGSNNYSSAYPGFISLSNGADGSENLDVRSGSPAIGAGANLSGIFTTDITGAKRPSTGGWTIGAYEGR